MRDNRKTRISSLQRIGDMPDAEGVNDTCHGNTEGVEPHDRAILSNVRVYVVCWGKFYDDHPDALTEIQALCKDLVSGSHFNGLAQYGVGRGSVVGVARIVDNNPPATLSKEEARNWLKDRLGKAIDAPAVNDTSMFYLLLPPPETKPTLDVGNGFCGYHESTKFHDESRDDDMFWALVRTDTAVRKSGAALVRSISFCASHELNETVTNRDGRGYYKGSCEIGDLCQQNPTFRYRGWSVQQYWSNWDRSCVNGDSPVSLRRVLAATHLSGGSVRALGQPMINVEYIASRFR